MNQSRTASLIESVFNVVIGYGVALASQLAIFPMSAFTCRCRTT